MTRRELREHCFKLLFCTAFYPSEEVEEQIEQYFGEPQTRTITVTPNGGAYDVVIADEINCALTCGLLAESDLLALIDRRPESVELVFTGRGACEAVLARADLITEMRDVRHYFREKRLPARLGIEM